MPKLYGDNVELRKPDWLKIKLHSNDQFAKVHQIVRDNALHTICSSGKCPNQAECWSARTATFMILGEVCTRNCRFCATLTGVPQPLDGDEPRSVAQSVALMGLKYAVVTSVTRDDLDDHGAHHWAETIEVIKTQSPQTAIEVLIPDMDGRKELLDIVINSKPHVIAHNIETVARLTPSIRSRARYATSLEVLRYIASRGAVAKSGMMLGLGESDVEVLEAMADLRRAGVKILTLGQYLRPSLAHVPVVEYITPEKFEWYRTEALKMGFSYCASAPLVRSSYLAHKALQSVEIDE